MIFMAIDILNLSVDGGVWTRFGWLRAGADIKEREKLYLYYPCVTL